MSAPDNPAPGATRIGGHAHRYLGTRRRSGTLVAAFRFGANILFDEGSDPGMIVLQAADVPLHPWAVQIDRLPEFRPGAVCIADADSIHLEHGVRIQIVDLNPQILRITPWSEAGVRHAREQISEVEGYLESGRRHGYFSPLQKQMRETVDRVLGAAFPDLARSLIGLGTGSTPSGDDFIVGQLAVLWAVRRLSSSASHQIEGFRRLFQWGELRARTSLASAQMILAAAEGSFSEAVRAVLVALAADPQGGLEAPAHILVSQGASSGIEMLSGILEAVRHLAE